MIKQIDKIPLENKTVRDQIRTDIQEALDKHIEKFEFDGYKDYENLTQNVREVVNIAKRRMINDVLWKMHFESNLGKIEARKDLETHYPFTIRSRKLEDRTHVYMEINFSEYEALGGKVRWL